MNTAQLSEVVHLATRLQSVGMLHNAALRDWREGDPVEPLKREAAAIAVLTESLAFAVGRLQASVASSVARPRLDQHITLPARATRPEAERIDIHLPDSEGATCD